jgi:Activator of Hsp90 ATPase homolog 1-like protein
MSSPTGLDASWTKTSSGEPVAGRTYELGFGAGFQWRAVVRSATAEHELDWEITEAYGDWTGTRVGFRLDGDAERTRVRFHHTGWADAGGHCRGSSYCWAQYLRLLKRYLELVEVVPYEGRNSA